MKIVFATFADAATAVPGGLVDIQSGGLTHFWWEFYPASFRVSLVLLLEFEPGEEVRERTLGLTVTNSAGAVRASIELTAEGPHGSWKPGEPCLQPAIIDLRNIVVDAPDVYSVSLTVDSEPGPTLRILATTAPENLQAGPAPNEKVH